jgi:hypothetical protein
MENLENIIKLYGGNGFSVGNKITWADLSIFITFKAIQGIYFSSLFFLSTRRFTIRSMFLPPSKPVFPPSSKLAKFTMIKTPTKILPKI